MRPILMMLVLLLTACGASPAPQFLGATRHDITLGGIRFAVLHKDDQAEVIRLGYLTRAQRDRVPPLMRAAVEQTTGCRVRGDLVTKLPGDTGEARARLDC